MTQENGIKSGNSADQNTEALPRGKELHLTTDFKIETGRKISGLAHFETVDKEHEIVLIKALEEALHDFMQHPILHYQHTERPVGVVTKAEIEGKGFYLEASLFETSDNDDVWMDIQKGELNKFSIYGIRKSSTPECKLHPTLRTSPCVTKALDLWSISIVGDNAINPETYLNVVKSHGYYKNGDILIRAETAENSRFMHEKVDSMAPDEDEKKPEEEEVEKSDGSELLKEPTNTTEIMSRLGAVEDALRQLVESDKKVHDTMDKGEEMTETEEKKEETVEKCNDLKKADETAPAEDTITKAYVADEVKKAFDAIEEIKKAQTDLIARIEVIEKSKVEKGGTMVFIGETDAVVNPSLSNLELIRGA